MKNQKIKSFVMTVGIILSSINMMQASSTHNQAISKAIDLYSSQLKKIGRDHVFTIMYDGDHGVNSYNKNITYAQISNVVEDVVIPAVGLYFPTQTDFGETFLVDTLSHPISPKDKNGTISLRQKAITSLIENSAIKSYIDTWLHKAKQAQADVMKMMITRDEAIEKLEKVDKSEEWKVLAPIVKPWYVYQKFLLKNPWFNTVGQIQTALQAASFASISGLQAYQAYQTISQAVQDPNATWLNSKNIDNIRHSEAILKNYMNPLSNKPTTTEDLQSSLSNIADYINSSGFNILSNPVRNTLSAVNYSALMSYFSFFTIRSMYNEHQQGLKNRNLIYALNQLITIAEKIESLCKNYGIETQFKPSLISAPKGIAMINGLKHPRYTEKESALVATPWVNTFINEIFEQDTYLAPYFALIGEIDAYNAIATRMIETEKTPNKFCMTQFLETQKPTIDLQGFWNIIVKNPVANNLNENRSIIFTGANAGGKSTAMRSILQNIILSQTFGIATGTSCKITPFDYIQSYLHVVDDPEKGLSRYAAELKSANDIILRAKTLAPDEKYFFIIDELFTGTGGKEGQTLAFEFINEDLAPYLDKTQFIFATHFDQLKEIEAANPQQFANYKIDAPSINAQGKLQYPFTISKGANNINIAALLKKESGLLGKSTLTSI